jgi:RNA polymerase sigma-70 factor (ECF subfamily)
MGMEAAARGSRQEARRMQRPGSRPATDRTGFAELVEATIDRVYRFVLGMTGDRDLADDLTQQTYLNLRRSWRSGRSEPSPAYVLAAARNTVYSRMRRLKLERQHLVALSERAAAGEPPAADDPEQGASRGELRAAIRAAVRSLEPDQRSVFLLSEVEGLGYAEIAAVLGCPVGTVGSRKHAAVKALRWELRRMGHAL